jgi:hypothetical protein
VLGAHRMMSGWLEAFGQIRRELSAIVRMLNIHALIFWSRISGDFAKVL